MTHLLDSDIVIAYLAGDSSARQLVSTLVSSGIAISLVTYRETTDGNFRCADPAAAEADFNAWMTSGVPILPFDLPIARRTARLRADLAAQGRRTRTRALDAATAIEHGLTLVTRNKADYQDIPNLSPY